VDHKNVEKTIQAALEEYKKIIEEPVGEAELKRVKDYIRGTTLIGLESSSSMASFVGGEEMLTGKPVTIDEVFGIIDKVTIEDIKRVAGAIIKKDNLNLAMIGPFKDENNFKTLLDKF
jgi:zinc protease